MPNRPRLFLLSPASCAGQRCALVMSPRARFPLAVQLRTPEGAPLCDVFAFLSGLYFRGKLAYARAFAQPPEGVPGGLVITPSAGLLPLDTKVTADDLRAFARVDIHAANGRYRRALERDARALDRYVPSAEVVLLGSIASPKYVGPLLPIFGQRLLFPSDFVGRGDMSRGGLLLRSVAERRELAYVSVMGSVRHGARPPKLYPLRRGTKSPLGR